MFVQKNIVKYLQTSTAAVRGTAPEFIVAVISKENSKDLDANEATQEP